jgi:long-subunit fatty acid transport protein
MGNVVWQRWGQFGQPNLEVSSTTSRKAMANLGYDDTWGFALGGRYKFAPDWQWSLGVAFDTSPMKKSQRTPALPLDQQVRVGTGVQYALNDRATIGAAYEYLNLGEADIQPQQAVSRHPPGKLLDLLRDVRRNDEPDADAAAIRRKYRGIHTDHLSVGVE